MQKRVSTVIITSLTSFFIGASLFCVLSILQKYVIGAPLTLKGFFVPFFFGGASWLLVGVLYLKLKFYVKEMETNKKITEEKGKYFESLFDYAPDGICIIDAKGFIKDCNQQEVELLGYSKDEIIGRHITEFRHPLDSEIFQKNFPKLKSFEPVEDEIRIITKSGDIVDIWCKGVPLTDSTGKFSGALLYERDVTRYKVTEKALQENEERLRTLLDAMPDIVCFKDGEGRWLEANKADLELFQLVDVSYRGKKDSELANYSTFYKDAFLTCEATDEKAWENGKMSRSEEIIPKPDGDKRIYDVIKIPLFYPNGERKGLLVLGRDITELKKSAQKLAESEARYRELVENANSIIMRLDTDGRIRFFNEFAQKFFGYDEKEIIGKKIIGTIIDEESEAAYAWDVMLANIEANPEKYEAYETSAVLKNGTEVWISWTNKVLFREGGRFTEILTVGTDVTEKKQVELEKQMMRQQLLHSQKMEAIGRLAGGIAHDFNNLLTTMRGFCDLALLEMQLDDTLRRYIEEIRKASVKASDLTRQLLVFSRKQPMELRSVNLNTEIENLLKMLERLIGEDITMEVELDSNLWMIQADPGGLSQIIMNLAVNSRDEMTDGGTIIIRTFNVEFGDKWQPGAPEKKDLRYVCLEFSDDGPGIDPGIVDKIFDPFFTTKGAEKGTGLGLSVVYGIVKEHGGWIDVESKAGKGTTFFIYFPARKTGNSTMASDQDDMQLYDGRGETILLVEDECGVRSLAERILKERGYVVISANCARKALKRFEEEGGQIDLIFTDVVLPDLNGVKLVEELVSRKPDLKVLFTTGYTDEKSERVITQEQGYPLIRKPYNVSELSRIIYETLRMTCDK